MRSSYRNHVSTAGVINSILDQDDDVNKQTNTNLLINKNDQNVNSGPNHRK